MGDDLNFLCVVGSNDVCWEGGCHGWSFWGMDRLEVDGNGTKRGQAEECWIHHIQNVPSFRPAGFSLTEVLFLMNLWLTWVLFNNGSILIFLLGILLDKAKIICFCLQVEHVLKLSGEKRREYFFDLLSCGVYVSSQTQKLGRGSVAMFPSQWNKKFRLDGKAREAWEIIEG